MTSAMRRTEFSFDRIDPAVIPYRVNLPLSRNIKKVEFTTYIFNAGWTDPTVVLEAGVSF
jgi:hypothetical protein